MMGRREEGGEKGGTEEHVKANIPLCPFAPLPLCPFDIALALALALVHALALVLALALGAHGALALALPQPWHHNIQDYEEDQHQ